MNNIGNRIKRLEDNQKGQDAMREPHLDTDGIIRKFGLDPEKVMAIAKANEQSIAWVIAGALGMSVRDFYESIKKRARGD